MGKNIDNNLASKKTLRDTLDYMLVVEKSTEDVYCIDLDFFKAYIYLNCGIEDRARIKYEYILLRNPKNKRAMFELGMIYYNNSRFDSAIFYFKQTWLAKKNGNQINDLNPKVDKYDILSTKLAYYMGISYYYTNNFKEALNYLNYSINRRYNLIDAYQDRALIYIKLRERGKACSDFKMAKQLGNPSVEQYVKQYCND